MIDWKIELRGDARPHAHSVRFAECELTVHRHSDYAASKWLFSCSRLGLKCLPLRHTDIELAKEEAVRQVQEFLRQQAWALRSVPVIRRPSKRKR